MSVTKILFVDDDAEDQFIMLNAFKHLGFSDAIHFESNGERALQYLNESYAIDDLPYLIILDLNMPRLNGTQVLALLKADTRLQHIPVIIYSTSLNKIEKEQCLQLGARDYIIKALTYNECLQRANEFRDLSTKAA